jgi:N-acetyl-gamma-glutamyl-phosphate reductase
MVKVGVVGSTGYAGQQLIWLLNQRDDVEVIFQSSHNYTNSYYSEIYYNYNGFIHSVCIDMQQAENELMNIDVLFIALPNGKTFDIVKKALTLGVKVIDFGADYRLKSSDIYTQWYKVNHEYPEALKEAVYGLPEINREKIKAAQLIANPGCYPTSSILGMAPLLKNKLIDTDTIIIDAKSGVSGAGRSASIQTLFAECNESIKAYGVGNHRHTPEIEQELSNIYGDNILISFTPHLVPMNRGILATSYSKLNKKMETEDIKSIYAEFYKDEYFVRVLDIVPETRYVKGSNLCHIGVKVDERTNRIIVVSAIDNLMKGAASQAIQNMNLLFNIKETKGLEFPAMVP